MGIEQLGKIALKNLAKNISKPKVCSEIGKVAKKEADDVAKLLTNSGDDIVKFSTKSISMPKKLDASCKTNIFTKKIEPLKVTPKVKTTVKPPIIAKSEIAKIRKKVFKDIERDATKQICKSLSDNFDTKKQRLIEEFLSIGEKDIALHLSKAKDAHQVAKILAKQDVQNLQKMSEQLSACMTATGKIKPLTLEVEQAVWQIRGQRDNFILAREKALHVASNNPEVIAIEKTLKDQYGCSFVSLRDNTDIAKQTLKAFETAKKHRAPLPQNVVITDCMHVADGENLFSNGTILLAPKAKNYSNGFLSSTAEYHLPLHEILHCSQPHMVSFSQKRIPKEFIDIKKNLSGYSATSQTHETFVELNTKRMVDGLSPREQELFDHLNFFA